ncbi:MAG: hypothetical protein OXG15_02300, partial [Gammaproteobacteria bacterium]|nr:hypothetical protein [Gammaproteobacteria bacterium]
MGLSDPETHQRVIEKLSGFEQLNPEQIKKTGSHPIEVGKLVKDARDRLQQLHKDDVDELYSFRISSRERVWCIRKQNVMEVLWWDP